MDTAARNLVIGVSSTKTADKEIPRCPSITARADGGLRTV